MPENCLYASPAMSQAFKRVLGEDAVKHITVPREIKYGVSVNEFLKRIGSAYNISKTSTLVFK